MNSEYAVYVVDGKIRAVCHYMCKPSTCRCKSGELAASGVQPIALDTDGVNELVTSLAAAQETSSLTAYRADFAIIKMTTSEDNTDEDEAWVTGLVEVNDGYVAGRYEDMPVPDYTDMMLSRFAALQASRHT